MTSFHGHPLCLLSLDGGGIRGVSELKILGQIMERIKDDEGLESDPCPADYFDMIGGTSTGGIIALLLGRLRMTVPECLDAYLSISKTVFSDKKHYISEGYFKSSSLESEMMTVIEGILGSGHANDTIMDTQNPNPDCKAFVCAVNAIDMASRGGPTLFRTYKVRENRTFNCRIWEAGRATSAAPTFFKRIVIGSQGEEEAFLDGGLKYNNPTPQVIEECKKMFAPDQKIACIVSIGTGSATAIRFDNPGMLSKAFPIDLAKTLVEMATDSDRIAETIAADFRYISDIYYRLNVDRGISNISLEEWEKIGEVSSYTKEYMKVTAVNDQLNAITKKLLIAKSQRISNSMKAMVIRDEAARSTPRVIDYDTAEFQRSKMPESSQPNYISTISVADLSLASTAHTNNHFIYPEYEAPHYVVRKTPLETIHKTFHTHQEKATPTVFVLLGMGGCGKSQLAMNYCRQGRADNFFSAIFWLDANSPASMAQSFANVAQELAKPMFEISDDKGNIQFVLREIKSWKSRWLLVFDNFDDPGSFCDRRIMEYYPQSGYGSIIITSRHAVTKNLGSYCELTEMSSEEALELLLKRSQAERTDSNIQEGADIVERLGYHALAIDQAGAYILARGLKLDLYMIHYSRRKEKVLKEIPQIWDYRRKIEDSEFETELTVFTTWELSIRQISGSLEARKDKLHILALAAFLDSKEVSVDLFTCYGSENDDWLMSCRVNDCWDEYQIQDYLTDLRNLSLLQSLDIGETKTKFSLHPMIQDWVKLRENPESRQKFALEQFKLSDEATFAISLRGNTSKRERVYNST
ncbi:hypothetical protein BP5796_12692 [Coleophoma crateriformis]|uniref:PNPLA domain-containing protein n=1 Tax=Coleophoma crateriformis TaxID=565419 RepID=A0A3D8Q600_9HELO|nr:hypothetical protein BP5796_12692 [Coleophoma crateriformis]